MGVQVFGTNKCFDTKKAQRFFKERNVKFQFVDLTQKSMSKGEIESVMKALDCSIMDLVNEKSKNFEKSFIKYLAGDEAKLEKILDDGTLLKTPIVRSGKLATVGFCPDRWEQMLQ